MRGANREGTINIFCGIHYGQIQISQGIHSFLTFFALGKLKLKERSSRLIEYRFQEKCNHTV